MPKMLISAELSLAENSVKQKVFEEKCKKYEYIL